MLTLMDHLRICFLDQHWSIYSQNRMSGHFVQQNNPADTFWASSANVSWPDQQCTL